MAFDPARQRCSPFDADFSEISAVDLARLALRADAESAALADEHRDPHGGLPDAVEARAMELSRLSDRLGELARRKIAQGSRPRSSMLSGEPRWHEAAGDVAPIGWRTGARQARALRDADARALCLHRAWSTAFANRPSSRQR